MYLDAARLRLLLVVAGLVVLVIVAVNVIGGDDEASGEQARQAAERFAAAVEGGDFDAACALMTGQLRSRAGGEDCPDQLASTIAGAAEEVQIEVMAVSVSGPKGRAETRVRPGEGGPPREGTLELEQTNDGWQVSSFGG